MREHLTFPIYEKRLREFIDQTAAKASMRGCDQVQETDSAFGRLALDLFTLQFSHNPAYRRFADARGISPDSIAQWPDIPAMPAAAFKELDLTSLPPGQRTAIFHSSGTAGQKPSRHFHSMESLSIYEASLLPWFKAHVLSEVEKLTFIMLTPPPSAAPRSSLVHMFETARRAFGLPDSLFTGEADENGAWTLDLNKTLSALEGATRSPTPVVLLGTAFSFVHLLDRLATNEMAYQLPPGSRALETGGYKGRSRVLSKAELHALIHKHLGIPSTGVIGEYGMSELSSQAYDRIAGNGEVQRMFRFPPWARFQIISPETGKEIGAGQTGLVRVCDLANVRSVLAVQTEDLGARQNDGFEVIGRAAAAEARGCSWLAQ